MAAVGAAVAAVAGLAISSGTARGGDATVPGTARADSIRDFTRPDLDGKPRSMSEWRAARVLVLAWTAPGCPIAMLYAPRVAALAKEYEEKGVRFVGVASGAGVDEAEAKAFVRDAGIPFPVLLDRDAGVAERLGVETTTAAVVLDENRRVRYLGAVDDQYDTGGRKKEATHRWLKDALDALLGGRPPSVEKTAAPGCPIEVPDKGAKASAATWNHDVAAIVYRRCASCHRPGEAAPFSLLTFADAKKHAATMRAAVEDKRMPPWGAEGPTGRFSNDRRLLPEERSTLLEWLGGGTPAGDGSPPAPPAALSKDGWEIGKPDAVLTFEKPEPVPAEGVVRYRFVEVPTHFAEDRWVQAVEVRPGAPQVVHHVLVAFWNGGKRGREVPFAPTNGFFAAMVPGGRSSVFPPGTAKKLPKGARLLFQMHYTPNGVATEDSTSIGFVFAKEPPKHEVHTAGAFNPAFRIPPGADDVEVNAFLPVPWDVDVLSFMPHMHLRGKSFRYGTRRLGEPEQTVLEVPRYDFNWQTPYRLATPMRVPKNTFFWAHGVFDNSEKNPYNPDPTAEVHWGEQTWDEMMIGYVDYVRVEEPPAEPK
jgi:peroxiredoxin